MIRPTTATVTILLLTTLTTWGQTGVKNNKADSLIIKDKIEGFYSWYADQIKNHREDYSPNFVKRSDGMTSLDFTKYKDGLKNHGFTDSFIERKIKDYKTCVDNLGKIKYETFLKFNMLDQYEEIKCDFNNVHEWTKNQQPHDGADLLRLQTINKRTVKGTVKFFTLSADKQKSMWDYVQATVTFKRQGKDWKIDDLNIERPKI